VLQLVHIGSKPRPSKNDTTSAVRSHPCVDSNLDRRCSRAMQKYFGPTNALRT
jgi:hypothetical protein